MSTWLQVQKDQLEDSENFTTTYIIVNSHNLPKEVFVYDINDEFSHVAVPSEISKYPITKEAAVDFYRLNIVSKTSASKTEILNFEKDIERRMRLLTTAWQNNESTADYGGTNSFTINAE